MDSIKQIKLSKDNFIVEYENSSLKLTYKDNVGKYFIDISKMNLISATRIAILCSTYCFIKGFRKKLCWIVKDNEIMRAISILRLRNVEQITMNMFKENKTELAS